MRAITSVAVLDHPKVPATGEVAGQIVEALTGWGVTSQRATTWDTAALEAIVPQVDLILVLGGDGSLLRAARVSAPHGKLVTSVNMGRLGFLSEMRPDNWREVLPGMIRSLKCKMGGSSGGRPRASPFPPTSKTRLRAATDAISAKTCLLSSQRQR